MVKNKDRWSALSMSERADFIKRAVEEGITERKNIIDTFNSLAEGGDTNSTESVLRPLMSKEEYLNSKRQEIIDKSLENSNNRTLPAVPYVINDIDEDTWRKNKETLLKEFQDKLGNLPETHRDRATIVDTISKLQQELNAGHPSCVPGASCIYTATDNYGEKYRVSGNRSFRANPSKYGFTEVGLNEIAPGDIIQDFGDKNIPIHALTFMGYDKDNEALFNYSRGGADKKDIRKNSGYYLYSSEDLDYLPLNGTNNDKFKNAAAYRFVGTEDDNKQWDSEYVDYRQSYDKDWLEMAKKVQNITPTLLLEAPQSTIITTSKKANGGRINKFGPGGATNSDEKISFWKRLLESGQSARDARVGAIGAQQVRDLYSEGKTEEAQELARKYAKANTTGIALASGAATSSLLGDLAVTGATTTADTLIDGNIDNFGRNFLFNAAADVVGHGAGKVVDKVAKTIKATKLAKALNNTKLDDSNLAHGVGVESKIIPLEAKSVALQDAISFEDALIGLNRTEQIKRFNTFAKKYGYEEIGESVSDEVLDKATKEMLERHNTFFRGVRPSEEVTNLATKLGISEEEALKIAATTPRAGETHVFVSPTSNAGIYGGGEYVAQVRRPYKLGTDRTQWFNEANFEITPGMYSKGNEDVIDPWFSSTVSTTEIPNELLMKKGEFVDWVRGPLEGKGSNNKIFRKYNKTLGIYEPEGLVKFANGGRILDGKTEENQTLSNTPWYQQNIQPLSPLGQAINNANAEFKYKYSNIPEEELKEQLAKKEAGLVSEYIDKEGKAIFLPKDSSLMPLEQSIAEWLPGVGEAAELGYIASGLNNEDYLNAAIGAGLLFLPGNAGKLWKKGKEALGLTKKASKTVRDPNLVTETINTISPNAEVADSPRRLTREAKITEAERQGIPKSERNNVTQKRSDVPKEIIDKHKYITFDSPKVDKKLLTKAKKGYESDSPIKSFASKLTDLEIHPMFKNYIDGDEVFENPVITQYRYYLEKQGIDPDIFSSDELSKILSYNLNEIQNSATGALKDNILWHSTSKDFDAFDFEHHLGDNTRNSGIFGAGNYFSTKYPQNYGVYTQPFIVSDIDALVDYSDIKGWKTKGIFDKKDTPKGLAVSGNNTGPQAATGFGNYIEELDPYYNQFEISVPKNSGIKSIFPHPSRFIVDDSGNISLLPVNWEDVRFNYGNGGKINRFDIGGSTTSTETNTQVVEGSTSSNPYKYSTLKIPYDRTARLNRQKPFYVTDENGNFVKGADGKVIPSVLGNILNTQLQPLRGIEGKYYYAPGSPHIGDSNKGGQPTSSDAEQFLLDWYNSPATIDIIKKEARTHNTNVFQDIPYTDENGNTMMYSPTPEETVALRSRLASEVPEYKDVPMQNNTLAYYRPKSSITEAPSLNDEVFKVAQDRDGVSMYIGPSIQYGDNESENSGSWVPLHELNHAFQHQLLPSYFNGKDIGLEHDELKSEQHSYLMALRASLGLNPEKRDYTKEDAQQMINALQNVPSGSGGPNKLLKVIDNDAGTLAHMLNTWAAADDPEEVKKELTLKYSKGGRILDGKTKRMYGSNNDNFRSVAKMNARKLSSKTLK